MVTSRSLASRGSRFVITGLMVNIILYGAFALLLLWGINYRVAATVIFVAGTIWGYLQNRWWSWRDDTPLLRSLAIYGLVYLAVYFIYMALLTVFVACWDLGPLLASILAIGLLVVPVFFAVDRIVFVQWKKQ